MTSEICWRTFDAVIVHKLLLIMNLLELDYIGWHMNGNGRAYWGIAMLNSN